MARDDDRMAAARQPGGAERTLLVALAHPDDEMGCAGTVAAHGAAGDRVVLLWLTRGEMTEAFGDRSKEAVAERRVAQGRGAAEILGAEARFLSFPDTRVRATPEAAAEVAAVIADVRPDALVTWGEAWRRGARHPDHQATGQVARDAVTLARLGGVVDPAEPHREPVPIFTLRGAHSTLPEATVDVTPHLDTVLELAEYHRARVGWPDERWLLDRLRRAGAPHGFDAGESFDAWESPPGAGRLLF